MTIVISYHTSFKKYIKAAFQIRLSTWQLLKLLPKEICIFFNVSTNYCQGKIVLKYLCKK